jgi:hypothetical protein
MRRVKNLIPFLFILIACCATISAPMRMQKFDKISKTYENALFSSQFEAAYQMLDPKTLKEEMNLDRYENIKVVDYAERNTVLSEDMFEIRQTVEIQYYLRDRFVLKTIRDEQLWRYYKEDKIWLLQTGLPPFEQ